MDLQRLNFGCGPVVAPGWSNSDIADYGQEHVGSITDGLPWPDGYFDGIVANHSLQALTYDELDLAVTELRRVLRPHGNIRVLVPDVVAAFLAFQARDAKWAGFKAITEKWDLDRKFTHYLTWGGQNRSVFTRYSLASLFGRHGFGVLIPDSESKVLRALDSRLKESIVMEFGWLREGYEAAEGVRTVCVVGRV